MCSFVVFASVAILPANGAASHTKVAGALANPPLAMPFIGVSRTSITAAWGTNGNPAGTGYLCENITSITNSTSIQTTSWESTGLTPGTAYSFRVKAINDDGIETAYVSLGSKSTVEFIKLNGIEVRPGEVISALPVIEFKIIHSVALRLDDCGVLIDGSFVHASPSTGAGFTTFSYSVASALGEGRHEIGMRAVDSDGTIYSDSV